ncbi:SPOR domain-containing protein [Hansschlegelia beijingensis]|uniref:SPOR domain-containing protein n=1 Tax=Hansschlegelia beijingensis TaxID=1133344 RepID=UPI00387EEBCD
MDYRHYDERAHSEEGLSPASPAVIWGALMVVAIAAASVTAWTAGGAPAERLIAADGSQELRRSVRELTAQRDELAERVARLERGLGELKLAAVAVAGGTPEVTGSIRRPAAPDERGQQFAVSLGPDASIDAVRRRWGALAARYPQALSKLTPRALRQDGGSLVDLVAGPFASRAEADQACATLADQGFACDTTIFGGEPLMRP